MSWALQAGARLFMGTFLCSPYNLVNNREGSAVRWRQFALLYGITDFQGYKNRTRSQNKTKDRWISHLDIVRYDPTAEVKGREDLIPACLPNALLFLHILG